MKRTLVIAACASPVAFVLGNLYVACLLSLEGMPIQNLSAAVFGLSHYVASGGGMSGEAAAICVGVLAVCAVWLMVARWLLDAGTHRDGEEHGSARWATKREVRAFADRDDPDNNILLHQGMLPGAIQEQVRHQDGQEQEHPRGRRLGQRQDSLLR